VTLACCPAREESPRRVRLLGLQALPLSRRGQNDAPQEAAKLGLVQGLASNRDDLFRMAREWINANPAPKQTLGRRELSHAGRRAFVPEGLAGAFHGAAMVMEKNTRRLSGAQAILRRWWRAPASISTPRCASSHATWPKLVVEQWRKT